MGKEEKKGARGQLVLVGIGNVNRHQTASVVFFFVLL